ncbi:hypothetical protein ACWKWC_02080 [Geodermatophilus nigrescens]
MATHVVRADGTGHHAGSLRVPAPDALAGALAGWARPGESVVLSGDDDGDDVALGDPAHAGHAADVARAHRARTSGRLVRFPGQDGLPGRFPLAELTDRCAVEAVHLLGVADDPALVLRTRGHVRPEFRDGVLVLVVNAWDDREVCPFEPPVQRECCADH